MIGVIGVAIALLIAAFFIGLILYALFEDRPVHARTPDERPGYISDEAIRRFMQREKL